MKVPKQDPTLKVKAHHDTDPDTPDAGITYFNCARCLEELESGVLGVTYSPKTYARQQAALTREGIQVWCTRHDCNITLMRLRAVRKEK